MRKENDTQNKEKGEFWTSNLCLVLIIVLGVLFVLGVVCSIWKVATKSDVSNGNVFGYYACDIADDNNTPKFKTGDEIIVRSVALSDISAGDYVAYSNPVGDKIVVLVAKFSSVDISSNKIYVTNNTCTGAETIQLNTGFVLGVVSQDTGAWVSMVETLNSSVMFWVFVVLIGAVTVLVVVLRLKNRK